MLRVGIVRLAAVAGAIADAIGASTAPDCRVGQGRITITFRRLGATRWSEVEQSAHARRVAGIARAILAADLRAAVRRRATRAIVVAYEDAKLVDGCATHA